MISGWVSKLCLALCLVLTMACTASATQQRLHLLQALKGIPGARVPRMLMTLERAGQDLSTSELAVLPLLLELDSVATLPLPDTEWVCPFLPQPWTGQFAQLRGPPTLLRSVA